VLLAPTDVTRGTPRYLVGTAQEHVAEQLKARGLEVIRVEDVTRTLPKKKRTAMMRCNRTQPSCIASLGVAAKTDVVMVTEIGPYLNAYKAGVRVYTAQDGAPLVEQSVPGVSEDQVLDALNKSLDVVVPRTLRVLRPEPVAPPPVTPPVAQQTPNVTPGVKQPVPGPDLTPGVQPPTELGLSDMPKVETPGRRKWAWVPAAGGVVLAGVGTVFFVQSRGKYNELTEGTGPLPNGQDVKDSGQRSQTIGVVGIGVGAAAIAAGALMYFLPVKQTNVQPTVTLTPRGGGLSLAGTWQ
jgi:hypothetical protein